MPLEKFQALGSGYHIALQGIKTTPIGQWTNSSMAVSISATEGSSFYRVYGGTHLIWCVARLKFLCFFLLRIWSQLVRYQLVVCELYAVISHSKTMAIDPGRSFNFPGRMLTFGSVIFSTVGAGSLIYMIWLSTFYMTVSMLSKDGRMVDTFPPPYSTSARLLRQILGQPAINRNEEKYRVALNNSLSQARGTNAVPLLCVLGSVYMLV